ncbi:hydrolase TatD [bacterium DOLZORAL124_64_63]|nr:MAG: hydrolase TatD [bacterium DOLZORAL124_64_63]
MIDSHVHLNREEFGTEQPAVMARARAAGVTHFLNVGYDLDSSAASLALAKAHPEVYATCGVHPHDAQLLADAEGHAGPETAARLDRLREMAGHEKVLAIGEIGLDFFRDLSPRPAQKTALRLQMELADELDLPVIYHIRDAWPEALALIDTIGVPRRRGILHAFAGDETAVQWARERGFLLGIGGPVTYKNSNLAAMVALAGEDMIVLETDAPWLPPVPHRGQRNESAYLVRTRERVAQVLDLSVDQVDHRTTRNFRRLFFGE